MVIHAHCLHCNATPMYLRSLSLLGCVWRRRGNVSKVASRNVSGFYCQQISKTKLWKKCWTSCSIYVLADASQLGNISLGVYQSLDNNLKTWKVFFKIYDFFPCEGINIHILHLVLSLVKAGGMSLKHLLEVLCFFHFVCWIL